MTLSRRSWCRGLFASTVASTVAGAVAGAVSGAGRTDAGAAARLHDAAAPGSRPLAIPPANDFIGLLAPRLQVASQAAQCQFGTAPFDAFGVRIERASASGYMISLWKHSLAGGAVLLSSPTLSGIDIGRAGFRCSSTAGMELFVAGRLLAVNRTAAAKADLALAPAAQRGAAQTVRGARLQLLLFSEDLS